MGIKPVILIIDDDVVLCSLLSTMLYTRNAEVLCAHSINEADKILHSGIAPSIIFLDNTLPDGLGIHYLSRLKVEHYKTQVIMMSDNDEDSVKQYAMSQGCLGFLEKPFSYLNVSELVKKGLKKSKKNRFRLV